MSKFSQNVGLGLRQAHYSALLKNPPEVPNWFEVITENFMDSEGRPLEILTKFRSDYPIALHGVSMSLGSTKPLDEAYLKRLKALVERIDPLFVSDHLCWSETSNAHLHDLLPLPYTEQTLKTITEKIDQVQSYLKRNILIENVSTYLRYKESNYQEWEFLKQVCEKTGARLILDVNNIYVNALNHGASLYPKGNFAEKFIDEIPAHLISEIHLAGHTQMDGYLFDTHSDHVIDPVWNLFSRAIEKAPEAHFMVEWDENIPSYRVLEKEALKAVNICNKMHRETS